LQRIIRKIETFMPMKSLAVLDSPQTLDLHIETDSFVPYYQQIVDQVRALVKSDALHEGDVFYSEGDIAGTLGISKMPVRQAFQKLRSEGLLIVEKGKRPVIGSGQVSWNFQQLRGFSEEMKRRGLVPSTKILGLKRVTADADIAKALHLSVDTATFLLSRLRYVNGKPVALVTSHLPAAIFPDLTKHDLGKHSLYQLFETTYHRKLAWAEETIGAMTAAEDVARILETTPGKALLSIYETTYDVQRTPIEYSHSLLRADRYNATVVSVRKGWVNHV
jgi:GntR family transcriptional regulator